MSTRQQISEIRDSAKLPVSRLDRQVIVDEQPGFWQRHKAGLLITCAFLFLIACGSWYAMNTIRPFSSPVDLSILNRQLATLTPEPDDPATALEQTGRPDKAETNDPPRQGPDSEAAAPDTDTSDTDDKQTTQEVRTWIPQPGQLFWNPRDYPDIGAGPVRVFVTTVRARVTAYTPYDHAQTHPEWADGVVAWHPRNRKRHVRNHPYCLASDWSQFPGGSTFIRVPGYMPESFPHFPENFRVVDDKCGRARLDNRHGRQPVIDVRYMTRHSAISGGKDAWGMKQLDVEVIFPANFTIPRSLRRWIIKAEWRIYENGKLISTETVQ